MIPAKLSPLGNFNNFGAFSFDLYLKSQKIHRRAFTKSPKLVEKVQEGPRLSPLTIFSRIRCALQDKLSTVFEQADTNDISPEGATLEALLIGEDGRMAPSSVRALQETGLYHLFAISGGHIAIITLLLFSLLRLFHLPQRTMYAALTIFLVLYTFLVEASPSVIRASLMTLAFLVGRLIWKDVDILNTISFSAFFLLLANPFSLFDIGFRLTFSATLAIILFFPRVVRALPHLPLKLRETTALSVSAMLGVAPIIATSFNRVTFISLFLNFVAIPLVGLIMGAGYVFLPLSFAFPFLVPPLAGLLKFFVSLFDILSSCYSWLPFLSYRIPTPPESVTIGYYVFLCSLLFRSRMRGQKCVLGTLFSVFAVILVTHPFPSLSKELKLTMIDVGQGESLLVEFPGRKKMLVDGGGFPESSFDVGEKLVSPFLWRKGIKHLDFLVLTHPHPDHIGGLLAVVRNFPIRELWEGRASPSSPSLKELKSACSKKATKKRVFRGYRRLEGKVQIDILHPEIIGSPTTDSEVNDHSLVLKITLGRISFCLTGDIGEEAEREILDRNGDLPCLALKAPHHGSRSSSSREFLSALQPMILLVSVGKGNLYGFPHTDVLLRYEAAGTSVFRTDVHGSIEVTTDGRTVRIRTASGLQLPIDTGFHLVDNE